MTGTGTEVEAFSITNCFSIWTLARQDLVTSNLTELPINKSLYSQGCSLGRSLHGQPQQINLHVQFGVALDLGSFPS